MTEKVGRLDCPLLKSRSRPESTMKPKAYFHFHSPQDLPLPGLDKASATVAPHSYTALAYWVGTPQLARVPDTRTCCSQPRPSMVLPQSSTRNTGTDTFVRTHTASVARHIGSSRNTTPAYSTADGVAAAAVRKHRFEEQFGEGT